MKVLTANGDYAGISNRSWPLAGLEFPGQMSSAWSSIELASLPSGEVRLASYATIFRTNPWVWACAQTIARGIARLPIHVFELQPDGSRKRVRGDLPGQPGRPNGGQQLDSLLRRPSPQVSRRRLVFRTVLNEIIYGNALWTMDKGPSGVSALWHVPWRKVVVHTGEQVPILFYEVRGNLGPVAGDGKKYIPEDVVHFTATDDPETELGTSPLPSLRHTIALHDALARHLTAFFQNQARLSGHLKVDKGTSKQNLEQIRNIVGELYTAPENAGKVLVSSGDWQPMSEAPSHSAVVELIKLSREEICAAFGVSPPLVGILDRAIKSNVKELREEKIRDLIGPWAESFESDLHAQLLPQSPAWAYNFSEFDMSEQLRPDILSLAEAYDKLRHVYAPNEFRRKENLVEIDSPDAKVPTTPLNERPLGIKASTYGGTSLPGTEPDDEPPPEKAPDDVDPDEEDPEDVI